MGYPKFEKQKYIRAVADNSPITLSKLAKRAAEAVNDFVQVSKFIEIPWDKPAHPRTQPKEMARRNVQPEPGAIRFGTQPGAIGIQDLYIDLLEQRSRGSFQPRITYWA